jgi:hypothetical protein
VTLPMVSGLNSRGNIMTSPSGDARRGAARLG